MTDFLTTFPKEWQAQWKKRGFQELSAIQQAVFEPLKEKESLIGISPTGSGKTLAYLLPQLQTIVPNEGSQLLVLTSSQELSVQVAEVAREWGSLLGLRVQTLIGGANVKRQIEGLKKKPEILVGTPGRVLELVKAKKIKMHTIKQITFDEADQLFERPNDALIEQLLHQAPVDYQLSFFSATGDRSIDAINQLLGKEIKVIDVTNEDHSRNQLTHFYLKVPARKKDEYLRRLAHVDNFKALVFFNQLGELGTVEEKLVYRGIAAMSLASDQNKLVRKSALSKFREGEIVELLTTDVAARGLDIQELAFVVNTEIPMTPESYLHRSGRTGRMGASGQVITFVQENNLRDFKRMMRDLEITANEIFIHGGALLLEEPVKEKEEKLKTKPKEKPKEKLSETKPKQLARESGENRPQKTKIKKRKKAQKNKGARRK